ncbi:hypothetical protein LWI28_002482 [Acer negundo]|uniref:PGG domain-containing protein n=1 Tax=Acer negundo TaxID=4023 RepID=A0AAD5JC25_ACENE|nr:hypothetical protein LWI28_002482 [Acer negundo]
MSVFSVFISGSCQLKQEILKLEEPAGPYQHGDDDEGGKKEMEKTKESHLIVAALIATVTFTAAFTLPGGVIQDGDSEGTAIPSKKSAFQAFVITDAIGLVLSLSAVFTHFLMSLPISMLDSEKSMFLMFYGGLSTVMAMGAMQEILKLEEPAGPYQHGDDDEGGKKEMEKTKESHLIVAALIATVTFTAAFTLPGGVIQDGDSEGTAIPSKKSAFQAFVITDAIGLVLSLSAVFTHFLMSLPISMLDSEKSMFLMFYGGLSTVMAMGAMVIAFVTGTYAVLTTSFWLAILTTFIGLSFFILCISFA